MSDLIIYKDLLIDLFNLSDTDIHSIRHEIKMGRPSFSSRSSLILLIVLLAEIRI